MNPRDFVLQNKHIVLSLPVKTMREAIEGAAIPLVHEGVIMQQCVTNWISICEEYGANFVYAKGFALVHSRPNSSVIDSGYTVATLSQGVMFGNSMYDPVHLLVCLAAKNDEDHLEYMKTIIQFLNTEGKIDELVAQKDVDKFRSIFNRI